MMFFRGRRHNASPVNRRGGALIEFAVCMPVFFCITMGTIETCHMIYLRQSLKIAAYECARLGIVPDMTRDTLEDQCDVLLQARKIRGYRFDCEPADPKLLEYGQLFTVEVSASADENALVGSWFYQGKTMSESVRVMAEH
ncbi:MAG: TadE/TadG family type IV pilus assembly protein [Aureliella sp.]